MIKSETFLNIPLCCSKSHCKHLLQIWFDNINSFFVNFAAENTKIRSHGRHFVAAIKIGCSSYLVTKPEARLPFVTYFSPLSIAGATHSRFRTRNLTENHFHTNIAKVTCGAKASFLYQKRRFKCHSTCRSMLVNICEHFVRSSL